MKSNPSFWQRIGLQDWFLKKDPENPGNEYQASLTPNDVFHYIVEKFKESINALSFANRLVFYHEYIICFNPEDYKEFMENKKGIFGLIVQESIKNFYEIIKENRQKGKTVEPSSSKWVFRFVSHPDYSRGDMGFIGQLLPGSSPKKDENLRVTFIPRQTGVAQTFDINPQILQGFTFYSEGYYEIPYQENYIAPQPGQNLYATSGFARFEAIIPEKEYAGKKIEYIMKDEQITVSGKEEVKTGSDIFRVPTEWVNSPHLYIRYNKNENRFFVASFGEKTLVNEKEIQRSEPTDPAWIELPINSRIVLNGIVGINIFNL